MTFWDWLSTGQGVEATHAFIALLIAATAYLQVRTRHEVRANARKLDEHIQQTSRRPRKPSAPAAS